MGFLSGTAAAAVAGRTVRAGILVAFDFLTIPRNLWLGHGQLWAGGEFWDGTGELGSISGLESAIGGSAPETSFSLSGVDPGLLAEALSSSDEVKGRDVTVYLQFFDEDMQTLDAPVSIYAGTMDVMRVRVQGPTSATISVTAETLFARRAMPIYAYLSDRDQQAIYPGDLGLSLIAQMTSRSVEWPKL